MGLTGKILYAVIDFLHPFWYYGPNSISKNITWAKVSFKYIWYPVKI